MGKINNNRKFPNGKKPRPDLTEIKKTEANERQSKYDALTVEQKIAALNNKLGVDQGAKRQRERLAALLNKKNAPASSEIVDMANEAGEKMLGLINESEKKHMKAKDRKRQERKDRVDEKDA